MVISLDGSVPMISGYLEFSFNQATGPTAAQAEHMAMFGYRPEPPSPALAARRLQAAPTVTTVSPEFHVSLTMMHRIGNFPMWYSSVQAWSDEGFQIADFLGDINYAIVNSPGTRWANSGAKPFDVSIFQATVGLIGFSAFLQLLVWLALVMISYDAPGVSSNKAAFAFTKFGSAAAAFFCAVALINFDASGYKNSMCKAYDPDATTNGKGCGYGDGFGLIVAATIACITHTLLMFFVVPEHVAASYAFAGGAAGGGKPLTASGYSDVGVSEGSGSGGATASFSGSSSFQSTSL